MITSVFFLACLVSALQASPPREPSALNAEQGAPFIRNFSPKEYGFDTQNWSIVQDNRGIMYFGNNDGLIEFDGTHWRLIKIAQNSHVRSLAKDQEGTIYVGGRNEFGYLGVSSNGQMEYISLINQVPVNQRSFNDIWTISTSSHGVYFVSKIRTFRYYQQRVTVMPIETEIFAGTVSDQVFIPLKEGGIVVIKDGQPHTLPFTNEFSRQQAGIILFFPHSSGKVMFSADRKGFFIYDMDRFWKLSPSQQASPDIIRRIPTEVDQYIFTYDLYSGVPLPQQKYALATKRGGVLIINERGKLLRAINKNHGLTNSSIHAIYKDMQSNLWLGMNKGLSYIETNSPLTVFSETQGIVETSLAIARHKGQIFTGLFNGIYYLPPYKFSLAGAAVKFKQLPNYTAYCFYLMPLGDHLIAAGNRGIMSIRDKQVRLAIQMRSVMCLGTSSKFPNTIFAGLYPGFAAATHQGAASRQLTFTDKKVFTEIKHPIYRIVGDSRGDLWLTSDLNGIYHIKFNSSSLDDYQLFHYHTAHGLPGKPNNFVQLVDGQVLAATPRGIYRAVNETPTPTNPSGVKFIPETTFGKMFYQQSIGVTRVFRDSKGQIWVISEDAGVGYLTKNKDNTYTWHNKPFKKLLKKTISEFLIESDGVAWFCTNEGIFRYDPTLEKDFEQPFNLNIRRATINGGTDIFQGTYFSPVSKVENHYRRSSILQPEDLIRELPYKYNSIVFEFSAAHYEHIPSIRYRYKLEGFDQNWSQWTAQTKKEYTNLDNGYYTFKVMARNVFGTNSRIATYDFSIAPPWYKTTLAVILFSLLVLLIVYGIVWINSRRLVAAKKKLEKIVHERTAQIEAQAEELKIAKETAEREREIADAANQSKSEFLARMSHEIRTPMNGVIGFSEMLMDTELTEDQLDYARTITRSGEALLSILNDILDFSKIEAGELSFDPIDFDPEMTAFDVCHLILPRVGDKEIEVICRVGDDVPGYIKTDPGRFRQVLINLMGNAAKFTEMGEIELALVVEKDEPSRLLLHITVRDTGIGIPADKLESIFNVFQQADGSTTRKYGGTGLGLAICRQIAKLMGGNVWAESAESHGSTFHFTCWVDKSDKKHQRDVKYDLLTNKRALILDDNKNNRDFLAHALKREGMAVTSLGDPRMVIPALIEKYHESQPFDICILDIQMPGTSGFDLAEQIRRQPDSIGKLPLLAFTSSTLSRSKKYKDSGFDGFLPKPVRRRKLIQVVARLLGLEIKDTEAEKSEIITRYSIEEEAKHMVHILLAEDNELNLKLAKYMLNKAGYQLSVAKNGKEAVDTYSANPSQYDIILMDIQMPLMDGRQATRELRRKGFAEVPIIAMTAESMDGDRERCLEAGMNDYISKPIKREIVFEVVKKWCLK